MIAVLGCVDGFGNDTRVDGIYPTLKDAERDFGHNFKYQEFDFGETEFDVYDAKTYTKGRK